MMRLHRVSPNIPPLNNPKKSSLQTSCKEEESNIQNYSHFDAKTSAILNPNNPQATEISANSSPSTSPGKSSEINGFSNGCDLPQWGHNKRSRGSRAESRNNSSAFAGGCEPSAQLRKHVVKVQRRSAAIIAAERVSAASASMPPPMTTQAGPALNSRIAGPDFRAVEDRSGGPQRVDRRPSQSPARKPNKSPPNVGSAVNSESKQPSDHETGGSCSETVAAAMTTAAAINKINFDRVQLPRIFLTLSRKEKEDDFLAMRGTKLPQRPKKRAKNVDRALQYCFPGMWLADLTRSRYEVREKKCVRKRKRGLKGMESMESDSE